jgi:hypothetical protein
LYTKYTTLVVFGGFWNGNVGIFYGHLEYFTAIWNILRPLGLFYDQLVGIFCGPLVYFSVLVCCK